MAKEMGGVQAIPAWTPLGCTSTSIVLRYLPSGHGYFFFDTLHSMLPSFRDLSRPSSSPATDSADTKA